MLTPYDTGKRLEPHVWVPRDPGLPPAQDPDDYGRVDFDNEEGGTELTVHVDREDDGTLTLHIHSADDIKVVQH